MNRNIIGDVIYEIGGIMKRNMNNVKGDIMRFKDNIMRLTPEQCMVIHTIVTSVIRSRRDLFMYSIVAASGVSKIVPEYVVYSVIPDIVSRDFIDFVIKYIHYSVMPNDQCVFASFDVYARRFNFIDRCDRGFSMYNWFSMYNLTTDFDRFKRCVEF